MNAGDRKNDYDTTKVYSAIKCFYLRKFFIFFLSLAPLATFAELLVIVMGNSVLLATINIRINKNKIKFNLRVINIKFQECFMSFGSAS